MNFSLKTYRIFLWIAEALLILFCLSIILFDFVLGNGDGIIDKFNLNALTIFLIGQTFILVLFGFSSQRKFIANTSIFVCSLLLCFFLMERLILSFPTSVSKTTHIKNIGPNKIFSKYDPTYFKNYLPNAEFITYVSELDTTYSILNSINSQGIRGKEIEKKKQGEHRILLLGDSFLQSDEVAFEHTIGQQLEQLLPDSISVFQHGQPSWSPLLELNWLMKKNKTLDADQVVLFLYDNDFLVGNSVGDTGYTPYARFDKQGFPERFDFSAIEKNENRNAWTHFVERIYNSNSLRWIRSLWLKKQLHQTFPNNKITETLNIPETEFHPLTLRYNLENDFLATRIAGLLAVCRDTSIWDQDTRQRVALSEHYLSLMHQWSLEKGIELTIALIPNPWQFKGENEETKNYYGLKNIVLPRSGLEQRLQYFCKQKQIPFCSFYTGFQKNEMDKNEMLYFPFDTHWTPRGHELAAQILYDSLMKNN